MSAARVAKLESLLERIQQNRRAMPGLAAADDEDAPTLEIEKPSAPMAAAAAPAEKSVPATPMEQALGVVTDDEEPELEIVMGDEDEDEPELVIEADDMSPTAPLDTPAARPARPAPTVTRGATPVSRTPAASAGGPTRLELDAPPAPSAAVARAVSQPEPTTFGELLQRTLALRPR